MDETHLLRTLEQRAGQHDRTHALHYQCRPRRSAARPSIDTRGWRGVIARRLGRKLHALRLLERRLGSKEHEPDRVPYPPDSPEPSLLLPAAPLHVGSNESGNQRQSEWQSEAISGHERQMTRLTCSL